MSASFAISAYELFTERVKRLTVAAGIFQLFIYFQAVMDIPSFKTIASKSGTSIIKDTAALHASRRNRVFYNFGGDFPVSFIGELPYWSPTRLAETRTCVMLDFHMPAYTKLSIISISFWLTNASYLLF